VAVITGGEGELALAIAAELRSTEVEVHAPGRADLDVTSADDVRRYFGALERLDLLINNAGVCEDTIVAKMSEHQWNRVVDVNLRGAFLCSQAAALMMAKQRAGHVINIGSFSARFGMSGQANYAAAKAGLIGLTQSLAKELGRRNVRVNCVLPGYLETKFVAHVPAEARERILRMHELGRFNTVADAARFVTILDTMSAVSGQIFQLDSRVSPWT
jgi:3-oxoacyl-[acyl-carrier protein] reductase